MGSIPDVFLLPWAPDFPCGVVYGSLLQHSTRTAQSLRKRERLPMRYTHSRLYTFQWARSVLITKCSAAAEDVHRLEADSKFFRSLLVVCALSSIVFFASGRIFESIVALAMVPPCFARYYERRLKSTTQAYIHIVTMHRLGNLIDTTKSNAA